MDNKLAAKLTWREIARLLRWMLLVILLGMYLLFLAPRTVKYKDKDWIHLWLGGRMIASGHADQLYDPELQVEVYRQADPAGQPPAVWNQRNQIVGGFFYPPPTALAYAAVAWLPMREAAVVNAYFTLALSLVVAWILSRTLQQGVALSTILIALLAYPPFFVNLSLGQNAVASLCAIIFAWYLCNQRKDFLAGLVLALLVCKPNWVLAIAWIPLIHGRWRMLAGLVAGTVAIFAGTILLIGVEPFRSYLAVFQRLADLDELPGYNLALTYNGLSVFRKWLGIGRLADVLGLASCALVCLVTWKVTWRRWQPGSEQFRRMIACCLAASLWVNPHLYYYDLLLTTVCVVTLCMEWRDLSGAGRLVVAALVIVSYLAVPWDDGWLWPWPWGRVLPVPSLAALALWAWTVFRLQRTPSLHRPRTD